MLGLAVTGITEASALGHMTDKIHIFSSSWGPSDDGGAAEQPGELLSQVLESAARTVRSDVLYDIHAIKYTSIILLVLSMRLHVRSCETEVPQRGIYIL